MALVGWGFALRGVRGLGVSPFVALVSPFVALGGWGLAVSLKPFVPLLRPDLWGDSSAGETRRTGPTDCIHAVDWVLGFRVRGLHDLLRKPVELHGRPHGKPGSSGP